MIDLWCLPWIQEERAEYVSHTLATPDLDGAIVSTQAKWSQSFRNVCGQESRGQIPGSPQSAKEVGGPAGVRIRGMWRLPLLALGPNLSTACFRMSWLLPSVCVGRLSCAHQKCDRMPLSCPLFSPWWSWVSSFLNYDGDADAFGTESVKHETSPFWCLCFAFLWWLMPIVRTCSFWVNYTLLEGFLKPWSLKHFWTVVGGKCRRPRRGWQLNAQQVWCCAFSSGSCSSCWRPTAFLQHTKVIGL